MGYIVRNPGSRIGTEEVESKHCWSYVIVLFFPRILSKQQLRAYNLIFPKREFSLDNLTSDSDSDTSKTSFSESSYEVLVLLNFLAKKFKVCVMYRLVILEQILCMRGLLGVELSVNPYNCPLRNPWTLLP